MWWCLRMGVLAAVLAACGARTGLRVGMDGGPAPEAGTLRARDAGRGLDADRRDIPCGDLLGAPICGGTSCTVVEEQDLVDAFVGNDAPSLTLDALGQPVVVLEIPTPTYQAVLGRRSVGGVWSWSPVPVPMATGSVARGLPEPLALVAYDGAFHTSILIDEGSGLGAPIAVESDQIVYSGNAWRDPRGTLWLLMSALSGAGPRSPVLIAYDGRFGATALDVALPRKSGGWLALGPTGAPHVTWNASDEVRRLVRWWTPERAEPETVAEVDVSMSPAAAAIAVGSDPSGDVPMIVYVDDALAIVVATREGGVWERRAITEPGGGNLAVVDVLASCDGPHVLYTDLAGAPGREMRLRLAHPDGTTVTIVEGVPGRVRGHAVRDTAGDVHVVATRGDTLLARYYRLHEP